MAQKKENPASAEFNSFKDEVYERISNLEISTIEANPFLGFFGAVGEGFKFRNNSGAEAKDLHIKFNKSGVKPVGKAPWGPFSKWSQNGQKIDLKKGKIANGQTTEPITFTHKSGTDIKITEWWWTNGAGERIGEKLNGESADLDPA